MKSPAKFQLGQIVNLHYCNNTVEEICKRWYGSMEDCEDLASIQPCWWYDFENNEGPYPEHMISSLTKRQKRLSI